MIWTDTDGDGSVVRAQGTEFVASKTHVNAKWVWRVACNASCQGPASTGTPLARVGAWGLEKLVKRMKMPVKIIKQKPRIVPGGSSSE